MKKIAFFAFRNNKMCFQHILLNAIDIKEKGGESKIIFEGEAVLLPQVLTDNPLYKKAKDMDLIDGVCEACSKMMEVYDVNKKLDINFLNDLNGHPAMAKYLEKGYEIVTL